MLEGRRQPNLEPTTFKAKKAFWPADVLSEVLLTDSDALVTSDEKGDDRLKHQLCICHYTVCSAYSFNNWGKGVIKCLCLIARKTTVILSPSHLLMVVVDLFLKSVF